MGERHQVVDGVPLDLVYATRRLPPVAYWGRLFP